MRPNPSSIRLAVCAALGVIVVAPVAQAAPVLPNGVYQATINPTPLLVISGVGTFTKAGSDGAWNSTFSFSQLPGGTSQAMEDNGKDISCGSASGTCGSSVLGKGAGSWDMTVTGGTFTASNFQVDSIPKTAGGTFVEYGSIKGGTIVQSTGAMTLDPTGRLGAVGNFPSLYDEAWNLPDGGTTYARFTTGSSTNASGTVTGHDIVSNGNGTFNVILVSASAVGKAWGGFDTEPYVETWNVTLTPAAMLRSASIMGIGKGGLAAGSIASTNGYTNGVMTASELAKHGVPLDKDVAKGTECVGGCFDFKLSGVTSPARVVLVLSTSIPTNPVYRKWVSNKNQWVNFDKTAPNELLSAPYKAVVGCPAAGDATYTKGLTPGYGCVELVIKDNGPNDQNPVAGFIADPGGVAQLPSTGSATTTTDFKGLGSGGCALGTDANPWHGGSWWLIGGMVGWLGFSRRRRSSQQS